MKAAISGFRRYLGRRYPGRSTSKHYMSDLAIFHRFVGDVSPRAVMASTIDEFVQFQSEQGLKATTINRRLCAISSLFELLISQAADDGWRNPVFWKRHSIRPGHRLPRDVSDETVAQLFSVITDRRDRAMFTLMVGAGLRVGEVVNLQLHDLHENDAAGPIRLRVCGKGDKERIVWLTTSVIHEVQNWLRERSPAPSPYLFLSQHERPLSVAGVQFRLKQYCERASVTLTCHQLRHTFARRLAEHKMPIESLAKVLGHRSLKTTQGYIDGADPTVRSDFLRAMERLEGLSLQKTLPATELSATTTFGPPCSEERPNPAALLARFEHLATDLPAWLQEELRQHTLRRIPRWQPHRAETQTLIHFSGLCRICRWLVANRDWQRLEHLQRADLATYVFARQQAGRKPGTIATELNFFRMFWRDLLDRERVSNGAVMQVKAPEIGDHLPRYLTVAEFQRLEQVVLEETSGDEPSNRFNRTWFYLLAHTGMRHGELLNLRLTDLDLQGNRLRVQAGKGNRDRVIPLTDHLVACLQAYLMVREPATTNHLLIHRHAAVKPHVIPRRLRRFGRKANIVPMSPHRLRHTLATFLINQGMPIVSLQKLMGHQSIDKTMIYARIHDETVQAQFTSAMAQIESAAVTDWPTRSAETADHIVLITQQIRDSV